MSSRIGRCCTGQTDPQREDRNADDERAIRTNLRGPFPRRFPPATCLRCDVWCSDGDQLGLRGLCSVRADSAPPHVSPARTPRTLRVVLSPPPFGQPRGAAPLWDMVLGCTMPLSERHDWGRLHYVAKPTLCCSVSLSAVFCRPTLSSFLALLLFCVYLSSLVELIKNIGEMIVSQNVKAFV